MFVQIFRQENMVTNIYAGAQSDGFLLILVCLDFSSEKYGYKHLSRFSVRKIWLQTFMPELKATASFIF